MTKDVLDEIKKRMDCLIVLNCLKEATERDKLKIIVNCLGLSETARLLGKDPSNLQKSLKIKQGKGRTKK